jgi:hypothetical protein
MSIYVYMYMRDRGMRGGGGVWKAGRERRGGEGRQGKDEAT